MQRSSGCSYPCCGRSRRGRRRAVDAVVRLAARRTSPRREVTEVRWRAEMRDRKVLLCVSIGGLVTLLAALLAIASAGAGHGNYLFARVLFPYTMLLTRLTDDTVTLPLIVLGLAQFPLYGAVVGLAASTGRVGLTLAHLGAVVLCFSGA